MRKTFGKIALRWKMCILFCASAFFLLSFSESFAQASNTSIIEITGALGSKPDAHLLRPVLRAWHISSSAVYQWENHLVIYGSLANPLKLEDQVAKSFPGCSLKIYQHPYYNFNRRQRCGGKDIAKEWNNILLTADLVDNARMQQEYLDYHKTQLKKWPKVAAGFCNAGFQQLLGFKNGRQLMLVISIPKGESLDRLNPKTTENNPQMVQWNALMKKYQVGIPGTKSDEVWVFLKPVNNL
ncbi:MAG: L-rhamnose mutarotase [Bacteroidetes bacterium]|nr:L-rhamnose mutarotase [Bacteroidota bacterium]